VGKTLQGDEYKKATKDDDLLGNVLKMFGEDGLGIMTHLIKIVYETGEWSEDFIEVKMTALTKKPKVTKCSDHLTNSLIAHRAKMVVRLRRRGMGRKVEDVLGDQCGFRSINGTRDAEIMSERNTEIEDVSCTCFID
jgi:hypothetical protein